MARPQRLPKFVKNPVMVCASQASTYMHKTSFTFNKCIQKERRGSWRQGERLSPFLTYSVKIMSLRHLSCISLSGPSWPWVSSGTIMSISLWQMKPALLLFINSITDQEEGVEGNPLVPLQKGFPFAPCGAIQMHTSGFIFLMLPVRMGLKQLLLPNQVVFICVSHKIQETRY